MTKQSEHLVHQILGYLGSTPDPGCEFPAFKGPKNTGERYKIILFDEYDESDWWSLITNHDNFHLNKNTFFPYSSSFDPVSSSSNHLQKIKKFTPFLISDSTVLRKTDHFDISFAIWKFFRSWELTKPTLLDPDHFPGSLSVRTSERKAPADGLYADGCPSRVASPRSYSREELF